MHLHPANRNRHDDKSFQERLPDILTNFIGTMKFIYWSTGFIATWIILNVTALVAHWDAYPFILLNLAFSAFAFYSAPLILMSQNRQTEHDRERAEEDFKVNTRSVAIMERLAEKSEIDISDLKE